MSRFSDSLPKHLDAERAEAESAALADSLPEILVRVSGDYSGSEPSDFMCEDNVRNCQDFLQVAEHLGWPNAQRIEMYVGRGGRPLWTTPARADRQVGSLSTSLLSRKVGEWRAYEVGVLRIGTAGFHPKVMLCDDGKLRCERSPYIFDYSFGRGYGTLPDQEISTLVKSKTHTYLDDIGDKLAAYLKIKR